MATPPIDVSRSGRYVNAFARRPYEVACFDRAVWRIPTPLLVFGIAVQPTAAEAA